MRVLDGDLLALVRAVAEHSTCSQGVSCLAWGGSEMLSIQYFLS